MPATAKKPHSRDLVSAMLFLNLTASEKLVLMALCWHYPKAYPSLRASLPWQASQSAGYAIACVVCRRRA